MASSILLMTATITPPPGVPNLQRTDPAQRIKDYQASLEWYISQSAGTFDKIVFAENSNSDVTPLRELARSLGAEDIVEFLSFEGLDYPAHYDRGYGEFKLLDYAMSNSPTIRENQSETTRIWKVTGRYVIRNIRELVTGAPSRFELYGNCRNWPKRWIDTYLLAWSPEGYEALIRDIYPRLKTNVPGIPYGLSGEELFRSWLEQPLFRKRKIVKRFRNTPQIEGVRGADGRQYAADDGWKIKVRSLARHLFPFLWI